MKNMKHEENAKNINVFWGDDFFFIFHFYTIDFVSKSDKNNFITVEYDKIYFYNEF